MWLIGLHALMVFVHSLATMKMTVRVDECTNQFLIYSRLLVDRSYSHPHLLDISFVTRLCFIVQHVRDYWLIVELSTAYLFVSVRTLLILCAIGATQETCIQCSAYGVASVAHTRWLSFTNVVWTRRYPWHDSFDFTLSLLGSAY